MDGFTLTQVSDQVVHLSETLVAGGKRREDGAYHLILRGVGRYQYRWHEGGQ